jgi:hypothetical protein
MKVFVKCKQCGGESLIPEASSYSEEDFKKFSGIAVCSHCGMSAPWTGEELIKKDEPKAIKSKETKVE